MQRLPFSPFSPNALFLSQDQIQFPTLHIAVCTNYKGKNKLLNENCVRKKVAREIPRSHKQTITIINEKAVLESCKQIKTTPGCFFQFFSLSHWGIWFTIHEEKVQEVLAPSPLRKWDFSLHNAGNHREPWLQGKEGQGKKKQNINLQTAG